MDIFSFNVQRLSDSPRKTELEPAWTNDSEFDSGLERVTRNALKTPTLNAASSQSKFRGFEKRRQFRPDMQWVSDAWTRVAAGSRAYLYCSTATIGHRALMLGVRSVSERDFIAAVSRRTWSPFLFPPRISRPRIFRLRASSFSNVVERLWLFWNSGERSSPITLINNF